MCLATTTLLVPTDDVKQRADRQFAFRSRSRTRPRDRNGQFGVDTPRCGQGTSRGGAPRVRRLRQQTQRPLLPSVISARRSQRGPRGCGSLRGLGLPSHRSPDAFGHSVSRSQIEGPKWDVIAPLVLKKAHSQGLRQSPTLIPAGQSALGLASHADTLPPSASRLGSAGARPATPGFATQVAITFRSQRDGTSLSRAADECVAGWREPIIRAVNARRRPSVPVTPTSPPMNSPPLDE